MKVFVDFAGKKKFDVKVRDVKTATDLPKEMGGDNTALTPPELLVASLGTCVGYYVLGYLNTAKLDPKGLSVEVDWDFDEKHTRIERLHVHVKTPNAVLGERKDSVLAAAEKCIVHNTLRNYPNVSVFVEGKD